MSDISKLTDAFIQRHLSTLLALIHGDQGEQRISCDCAYCWPENPEHEVAR